MRLRWFEYPILIPALVIAVAAAAFWRFGRRLIGGTA